MAKKSFVCLCLILFACSAFSQKAILPNTLSKAEKLYGLSKFWSEVNYNFVFLNNIDRQLWDNTYKELLGTITETKNNYEYLRELQKFCALLKDGHTGIYSPNSQIFTSNFGDYRIWVRNIENKAIIYMINESKKDEIPIGSEIVEVNGIPTSEHLEKNVAPYISSSTDYVLSDWSVATMLSGMAGDSCHIKIRKPNGKEVELTLKHGVSEEREVYPQAAKYTLLEFKWLDEKDKMAYVALNRFADKEIVSLFIDKLPELKKAKSLVIDLRKNGGGNSNIGKDILEYLAEGDTIYGSSSRTRMHISAYKAWGNMIQEKDSTKDEWHRKVYLTSRDKAYYTISDSKEKNNVERSERVIIPTAILVSHQTASAAEDFLIAIDNQKHMTKIGTKSFGSTGQPLMINLVPGIDARICTKENTYPDGRKFIGVGVLPDIEVNETVEDFINGKDPILDKAKEYLKEQGK